MKIIIKVMLLVICLLLLSCSQIKINNVRTSPKATKSKNELFILYDKSNFATFLNDDQIRKIQIPFKHSGIKTKLLIYDELDLNSKEILSMSNNVERCLKIIPTGYGNNTFLFNAILHDNKLKKIWSCSVVFPGDIVGARDNKMNLLGEKLLEQLKADGLL